MEPVKIEYFDRLDTFNSEKRNQRSAFKQFKL